MYTIIGGDGQEYGPVAPGQIKSWLAAGRANLETKAKLLGTDEWRRLGDFAELGGSASGVPPTIGGAGPAPSAAGAPPVAAGDAKAIAEAMIARAGQIDIANCYERSWNLLKAEFWPLVGVGFMISMLNQISARVLVGNHNILGPNPVDARFCAGVTVSSLLGAVLWGGYEWYILKKIRGEPTTAGDAFEGFRRAFGPLVLVGLLTGVLCALGLVFLLLPGIYLWVGYRFAYLMVLDKRLDFWTAMEVSRRVVTAQWWRVFGLALLAIPFGLLGLCALVVGVFIAIPLIVGAMVCAYEDMCAPRPPK